MILNDNRKLVAVSPEELAQIGNGALSYIKEVEGRDVIKYLGPTAQIEPDDRLFCLFNANGAPISISGSREAAEVSANEHELVAASVH